MQSRQNQKDQAGTRPLMLFADASIVMLPLDDMGRRSFRLDRNSPSAVPDIFAINLPCGPTGTAHQPLIGLVHL